MINLHGLFWLLVACLVLDMMPWTPRPLRRVISSWQGLAAGAAALGIYLYLPGQLRRIDPTAGTFDAGFLHWIGLASVLFFGGIFAAWLGWQIAWRSLDRAADAALDRWFAEFPPQHRWILAQGAFVLMLGYWLACLWIVPLR